MTAPSATGTLADTPLAHALVYARNRRLSGRLELTAAGDRSAAITLWRGRITAVETTPLGLCPGGFLGSVVYELGFIDSATLDTTLLEISRSKRLHGEVLIERGAITAAQRDEALIEQVHRKVHHLFTFSDSTTYAFYDARLTVDDPPVAVDPVGPIWRGVRDYPPIKFVEQTIRLVADHALRVTAGGSARLPPAETALVERLALRPMTLAEMKAVTDLPIDRVELLVYLLVISKCVEAVSGARTHPSTGALPTGMPSGPMRAISGETRRVSGSVAATSAPIARSPSDSLPAASSATRVTTTTSSSLPPGRGTSSAPPRSGSSSSKVAAQRPFSMTPPAQALTPSKIPARPYSLTPPAQPVLSSKFPPGSQRPPAGTLAALQSPSDIGVEAIIARAEMIDSEDFFDVLGVADNASAEAVRAAYVRLAKTWHADRLPPDLVVVRDEISKIFSQMTRAQRTLCDAEARQKYLVARAAKKAARPRGDVVREIRFASTKRDAETVIRLCQELIDTDPDDAEALALQAWATVRFGEASEDELRAALTKIDKAVNVNRIDEEAVYHRGLVHKRLGNVPAAFRDFARALQLNPKHVEAEREVRIFAMRARKGSGEHKLALPLVEKLTKK